MLSKELELTLNVAFNEARLKRHEFMTVEHLLVALLDNSLVHDALKNCGANIDRLRLDLNTFINETTPLISVADATRDTQPTLGFQRVLQRAVFHVQSSGKDEVTGINVLAAIFSEQDSQAVYLLKKENISRLDVVNSVANHQKRTPLIQEDDSDNDMDQLIDNDDDLIGSSLEKFAINLNKKAKKNKIDPLIGREQEVNRCIQILARRRKNNPLLVGEAGVGKTAIAEGLAKLIVEKKVPSELADCTVYSLDLGALLAGTKYRGDFEKRLKQLLNEIQKNKKAILFIDEIHTIIGAGAASGGVMDASNLIKPKLASGELRCIGATTYQEFRTVFEKDKALTRRYQKVDIQEPTEEDTLKILKGIRSLLEEHHHIKIADSALKAAVSLSKRYINDRFLPDKAIDLIDETAAHQILLDVKRRKQLITVRDVEEVTAQITRLPLKTISKTERQTLRDLEERLAQKIYGQNEAIVQLVDAIKLSRSGLNDESKPIGCFMFAGPTGVGKTEVCKHLSEELGLNLVRFDMSEYLERHAISRLVGAPPGYVGHDNGGMMTEAINKNPHSLILLDEIEKAHPDIFPILLQVMDHGCLTDSLGRKADFKHAIIVMTTNVGAEILDKNQIGFTQLKTTSDLDSSIKKVFTPEFRNRLDAIVHFNALQQDIIYKVVRKEIDILSQRLKPKQVQIVLDESGLKWLSDNGYDIKMGARPIARIVKDKIAKPLSDELLFGLLMNGGTVVVKANEEGLVLDYFSKENYQAVGHLAQTSHSDFSSTYIA
ncbi:ATP-dependent Clp protease ATP-binding subunit ClpA [bacterium]|nr:ATP-dependent Clp protease ATP-binding subunit ClpA [bacterium]